MALTQIQDTSSIEKGGIPEQKENMENVLQWLQETETTLEEVIRKTEAAHDTAGEFFTYVEDIYVSAIKLQDRVLKTKTTILQKG